MSRVPRDRFLYGVSKSERRAVLKAQDRVLRAAVKRVRKQMEQNAAALQKLVSKAQGRDDGSMLVCPDPDCGYVPRDEDEAKGATCPKCGGDLAVVDPVGAPGAPTPKFKPGDRAAFTGDEDEQRDADEDESADEDEDESEEEELSKDDVTGDDDDDDDDLSSEERARRGVAETRFRAAKRSLMDVHRDGKSGAPLIDGVRQAPRRKSHHGGAIDGRRID